MEKICHNVTVSVFVKEGESKEDILNGLKELFPFDVGKFLKETVAEGALDNKILILKVEVDKNKLVNAFLENLNELLSEEQKEMILSQVDSRVDEEGLFYLRIEKDRWLNGQLLVTDKGNCYHMKINVAAFPKHKDNVVKMVKKIFENPAEAGLPSAQQ